LTGKFDVKQFDHRTAFTNHFIRDLSTGRQRSEDTISASSLKDIIAAVARAMMVVRTPFKSNTIADAIALGVTRTKSLKNQTFGLTVPPKDSDKDNDKVKNLEKKLLDANILLKEKSKSAQDLDDKLAIAKEEIDKLKAKPIVKIVVPAAAATDTSGSTSTKKPELDPAQTTLQAATKLLEGFLIHEDGTRLIMAQRNKTELQREQELQAIATAQKLRLEEEFIVEEYKKTQRKSII
jgi:hypothetical protein